jgi:hypothetical protein
MVQGGSANVVMSSNRSEVRTPPRTSAKTLPILAPDHLFGRIVGLGHLVGKDICPPQAPDRAAAKHTAGTEALIPIFEGEAAAAKTLEFITLWVS